MEGVHGCVGLEPLEQPGIVHVDVFHDVGDRRKRPARRVVAGAVEDPACRIAASKLHDEPGLPDAQLAAHQHQSGAARHRLVDALQVGAPPHKGCTGSIDPTVASGKNGRCRGGRRCFQQRFVTQDLAFQGVELGAWLKPKLLPQPSASILETVERLLLAAIAIQGLHQGSPVALVLGMVLGEHRQFRNQRRVVAVVEAQLDLK